MVLTKLTGKALPKKSSAGVKMAVRKVNSASNGPIKNNPYQIGMRDNTRVVNVNMQSNYRADDT